MTLTLQRALLATVVTAILAGMIPAGIALDRRLASALEARARADLSLAPRLLADRNRADASMLMMQAKDFAHADGLADALARGDKADVLTIVSSARIGRGQSVIVVGPDGRSWTGRNVVDSLVAATRAGRVPVVLQREGDTIESVALAPVLRAEQWVGAAGLLAPLDAATAGVLSGLTRSDVIIVNTADKMIAASTLDTARTREVMSGLRALALDTSSLSEPHEILTGDSRRLVVLAPLGSATVVLTRALRDELSVLPELRRVAFISALGALVLAFLLGAILASRLSRPVRQLDVAARAITDGDFAAELPHSRIREVQRMAVSFDSMRQALAERLAELRGANEALVDRNARLTALQADLMQRDRLAASGRLVTQLAHEIRNPVANLRNCLELIRRRVGDDAEAREFTDLAIDELLRMHELAEQMLDLNRPRDAGTQRCDPVHVAREVATLASLGDARWKCTVASSVREGETAALSPDSLKQILFNLVQNAGEAMSLAARDAMHTGPDAVIEIAVMYDDGDVALEVRDRGPGIPEANLTRVFDPFFTTKEAVHGVGLGLFVAEGLLRTAGGRLSAGNRAGGGAWFRVQLPSVGAESGAAQSSVTVGAA